jgi:hypothetical protein
MIENQPFVSTLERWLGLLYGIGAKAPWRALGRDLDF